MTVVSPLTVKASAVPTDAPGEQWLVEVTCARPANVVLAIILDLSDSCGAMRNEASKLPRLFAHLPRDTAVWVYRLSSYEPVDSETHRIAHLQDGSLQLSRWLDDVRLRESMARRGSLLRPTLESIAERKTREGADRVRAIILTDGELLDVCEVSIANGIDIVGLTASTQDAKCKHWRRILPHCPLFDLLDSRFDRAFADVSHPFYGACEVSWQLEDAAINAHIVDVGSKRLTPVDRTPLVWNFVDRPLMLLLATESATTRLPTIGCRSVKSNDVIELCVTSAIDQLGSELMTQLAAILKSGTSTQAKVVLDVDRSHPKFAAVCEQFLSAETLSESRDSWIDATGTAKVWHGEPCAQAVLQEGTTFRFDALLCVASMEPDGLRPSRIVLVALEKHAQPALQVGPGVFLDFGSVSTVGTIWFDSREARWMLSQGSQTRELDPRHSEEIVLPVATQDGTPLTTLFSGPLR